MEGIEELSGFPCGDLKIIRAGSAVPVQPAAVEGGCSVGSSVKIDIFLSEKLPPTNSVPWFVFTLDNEYASLYIYNQFVSINY